MPQTSFLVGKYEHDACFWANCLSRRTRMKVSKNIEVVRKLFISVALVFSLAACSSSGGGDGDGGTDTGTDGAGTDAGMDTDSSGAATGESGASGGDTDASGGTDTGGGTDTDSGGADAGAIPFSDTSAIDAIWMDVLDDETLRWLDIGASGSYRIYGPISLESTATCNPVSGPFAMTNIGDSFYEAHDGTVYRVDFGGQALFKNTMDGGESILVNIERDRIDELSLCS